MLKAEQYENKGSKVYTKPCGGLLAYQPVKGKAVSAATSKLDAAVSSRGALQKIQQLADEHNWTSDGKRNDASLITVITALMADELGQSVSSPSCSCHQASFPVLHQHVQIHHLLCTYASYHMPKS